MRRLAWHTSFRRAFKRCSRNRPDASDRILAALTNLLEDPFDPRLKIHKLRGKLEGLLACWVEYDCRIVFALAKDPESGDDLIVLVDIGTHDEVY